MGVLPSELSAQTPGALSQAGPCWTNVAVICRVHDACQKNGRYTTDVHH